jgi:UDP-GlcNAc:undecaprenyl-phosphate/decaprenyl-phosphate GlcNAc-1-phosphate transferase
MTTALFFLVFGFLVAVVLTPWVIRMAHTGVGMDVPDEARKHQVTPVPRLGGMPLMLALAFGLIIILLKQPGRSSEWFPVLVGASLMYGLGLWDDVSRLGARRKLVGQIAIAALVNWLGLTIEKFSLPGYGEIDLGAWSVPVTIFWLISIPNIVNLIDGLDGLAGGLGMFMALTLGTVGYLTEHYAVTWFAFTMAGALLGFLVFNFPPAKIYLGDGGAYLIGFVIAALSMSSSHKGSIAAVLLVTIIGLGLPILDTTFALMRRAVRGFPIFHADGEHFHHRLQEYGFSKPRILFGLYGVCVVLSLLGLMVFWNQGESRTVPIAIGAGVLFLLAMAAVRHFHRVRSWQDAHRTVRHVLGRRQAVQYALLQAKVLQLEIERCESADEFWEIFDATLRRVGFCDEGDAENCARVEMRHNGSKPWILYAPVEDGTVAEWHRIAECFRPAYARAFEKWGR